MATNRSEVSLPRNPTISADAVDKEVLLSQEAHRVGLMSIRFSALVMHPLQRSVNPLWVENLALQHFENGDNVQKSAHPIMVMAVEEGKVELHPVPDGLPTANSALKFYLISGQAPSCCNEVCHQEATQQRMPARLN
ncbi:hypothetical protein BS47DRAFT_1082715 [Hydnum rufescens UP504]|uniref:Uncharacterized protein n=1 Tax=Hydnum rufescens UP504 TaxID=1448309 RepID=A0A9P6B8S9_9AGAM|nr:hypothetical protein BS47DRAFT_1082715 [Hydnum rufescens UP504]